MVKRNVPEAASWLLGFMLGLDLMFSGLSWLMLSLAVHKLLLEHDRHILGSAL